MALFATTAFIAVLSSLKTSRKESIIMEEGSLLQEALNYMERMRDGRINDDDNDTHDALQMDVFELQPQSDRIAQLQHLAKLAVAFNNYMETQSNILWHVGFPPVFGICVTNNIPHLRATCRYGDNVGDEWMALRCMMELSKQYPTLAIDCWDLDAGPILLIEGSEALPDWINDSAETDSRFTCWIVNGKITLIGPTTTPLALDVALDCLRNNQMTSTPAKLQAEVTKTVMNDVLLQHQRTALVVPRPVALLLKRAPMLANAAAVAYTKSGFANLQQHEDWVWTTCRLARTNYAMLRTLSPQQTTTPKLSPELKRIQRTCANEATPHVRHALELGMRLTAGLDALLNGKETSNDATISPLEQRVFQYWAAADVACGGNGMWLQQAWQLGPKKSPYDMQYIIKCPVFPPEAVYPFPISHAGMSLSQVARSELSKKTMDNEKFSMPRPSDVDGEEWLYRGDELLEQAMAKHESAAAAAQERSSSSATMEVHPSPKEQEINDMMQGFQNFMSGESEMEGIASHASTADNQTNKRQRPGEDQPVDINPRIFLNLMHSVLKSSPEELARNLNGVEDDPFFSEQDYRLMEPGVRVDDDDDSSDGSEEMEAIMDAMDTELRATAASRAAETGTVAGDARALSNLVQSLGASEGAPGPVGNMLKEMGVEPPKLRADDMDEELSDEEH